MDLTATKAVVLVLLGMIKLVSGLAPLLFTKIFRTMSERFLKKFIGVVLCFGGGVLLSTVFIHMVTEVRESLERATTMGMIPIEMEFPFAELLICMGFLLILLIESVVHKLFGGHNHSHFPSQETLAKKMTGVENIGITIPEDRVASGHDNTAYENEIPQKINYSSSVKITQPRNTTAAHPDLTIEAKPSPFSNHKNVGINVSSASLTSYTSYTSYSSDSESLSHELSVATTTYMSDMKSQRKERKMLTSLRSFLMVLALSIHSIFEGMAIGLEETEAGVWKLFLAVSIHATAIVFCIGTEMISSGTKKSQIVMYMVVLSIVTPIGVLIGIIVTVHMEQASGEHVLVIGLLQGLAGGTLLYITFFEVLARDKLSKYGMSGLIGALAVIMGFTLMAAMEAGAGGHSHGGHVGHGGHVDHGGHDHKHHEEALTAGELNKEHDHDHHFETGLRHRDEHHQQNEPDQKNEFEDHHKDLNGHHHTGDEHVQTYRNFSEEKHPDEKNHEEEQNHRHEINLGEDHENEDLKEHANNHKYEPNHAQDHNDKDEPNQNHNEDEHSYENVQNPEYNHNHEHKHDPKDEHGQEHHQDNNHGQAHELDLTNDNSESDDMIKYEDTHEVTLAEHIKASKDEDTDKPLGIFDHEINVSVNVNESQTSPEYFAYNVTDDQFLHDSGDYHQE